MKKLENIFMNLQMINLHFSLILLLLLKKLSIQDIKKMNYNNVRQLNVQDKEKICYVKLNLMILYLLMLEVKNAK